MNVCIKCFDNLMNCVCRAIPRKTIKEKAKIEYEKLREDVECGESLLEKTENSGLYECRTCGEMPTSLLDCSCTRYIKETVNSPEPDECSSCSGEGITLNKAGDEEHCYHCWGLGSIPFSRIHKETVNSPEHYNKGKIEVIDFIEDQKLDFALGNAIKYICRANHKGNRKEDIKKAVWYLERKLNDLD